MIGLVDCNNFFVSCERLFRPDLRTKPVAVLSSNDGCIVARSQQVKDLGIPMGIPYFEVADICRKNKITLFSSNFALYRDVSERIMNAIKYEFDTCEVYSIDEAFFEIHEDITNEKITEIRTRIIQKTGIPVSIGVASTKTLAKVANSIAKKQINNVRRRTSNIREGGEGVCIMDEQMWKEVMREIPCGSVWGIGRQISAFLRTHNIYSVFDLLSQDKAFIQQSLGVVGERLVLELSGISVYTLGESKEEEQQSYTSSRSFSQPITDKRTLMSALGHHVSHIAEKLRLDGNVASKINIIIQGSRFGTFAHRNGTAQIDLMIPTDDTFVFMNEVSKLLESIYDSEIPYKKAGVVMSGIRPKSSISDPLFGVSNSIKKTSKINSVTDTLNKKFGIGTVRSAVTFDMHTWKERKKLKSPEYTTQWTEIAIVKAK